MKAIKKFLYMVTAVAALFATSCTEQIEYDPAPKESGQQVSFAFGQKTKYTVEEPTALEFVLNRVLTDTDYTVDVTFRSDEGITLAGKPTFKAGENTAKIIVNVDPSAIEVGNTANFMMTLVGELSSYGDTELECTVTRPAPKNEDPNWSSIGTGIYRDDCLIPMFGGNAGVTWEVDILQNKENPNLYRVADPYSEEIINAIFGSPLPSDIAISETNEGYLEFDVTDPNQVVMSLSPLGFLLATDNGLEEMYLFALEGSFGLFSDGIITFPTKGMAIINEAGSGWYANSSGAFAVIFPGAEILDASIDVSYAGKYVSADSTKASAVLDFQLGADVDGYVFSVVEGDLTADYSAVVAGMLDGTIEVNESTADETRWEVELTAGNYTVVAIPSVEGELKDGKAVAMTFYFSGAGELPEATITTEAGYVADLTGNSEHATAYPAEYWFGIRIEADASELKAIHILRINPADLDAYHKAGYDDATIMEALGQDATEAWLPTIAERGYVVGLFNVPGNSEYSVLMQFTTIYGTTQYVTETFAVAPWKGTYPVGPYTLSEGEGDKLQTLKVSINPATSDDYLFFTVDGVDGSMWYTTLDKDAKTLTCGGVEFGYEHLENQFGAIYGWYNQNQGLVYSYCSYATTDTEYADPTAPLVINLNDDLTPKSLGSTFVMVVVDNNTNAAVGNAFMFTPEAVFTPYVAEAQTSSLVYNENNSYKKSEMELMFATGLENTKSIQSYVAAPFVGDFQREYVLSARNF